MKPDREGESDSKSDQSKRRAGAVDAEGVRGNRCDDAVRPKDLQTERLKPTKRGLTETGRARRKFTQCFSFLQRCRTSNSSSYKSSQMDF